LLIKELIARGDLQRCLIVCPGNLVEQWQDELYRRFNLPFEILTNDQLEASHSGNWFSETNLAIARLDKLSRDENVQQKLKAPECQWDLVVCDEAHKMSASFFGNEVTYTKRYRLGQLLSSITRHFLLMTATPHNGKQEDFHLFMKLLDSDRFEGRFREGVHEQDVSDIMRRMVKENLLKMDGTPLFPERTAITVPYALSEPEAELYRQVTSYVREEFNRAEALDNDKRKGNVGFALTILQRRLASSPEAIYRSLTRRRERLESKLIDLQTNPAAQFGSSPPRDYDLEDIDDVPEDEVETIEREVLDQATAARTAVELKAEIETLKGLELIAADVRRSGTDTKWRELASVLSGVLSPPGLTDRVSEPDRLPYGAGPIAPPEPSPREKFVIFTEHRDTLNYLERRISTLLGQPSAIVTMHGGMGREERRKAQESFLYDPSVRILLATDAAGEGINLQRAHLMVNYDLPWNPNRLEQRFGRIHRIGQTEVCYMWNLVANGTREGEVYSRLLEKLARAREALGGQVFDVLGKLQFEGKPLRELLIEAIRYGEQPEVRARLTQRVESALDLDQLRTLLQERALTRETMDTSRVFQIGEMMQRAEARRLQPHYVESFFLAAFARLGGTIRPREPRRYEVTYVPASLRNPGRSGGVRAPVLAKYERVVFDKSMIAPPGGAPAAFLSPGHPLLNSVIDVTLDENAHLLRRGTVLVDERDDGTSPRVVFCLEHEIQDASVTSSGNRRVISKRALYIELSENGQASDAQYAPYLDFRPLKPDEPGAELILKRPECGWISAELEEKAREYAVLHVVPEHLSEVRSRKLELADKTEAAVRERLVKEIAYWDRRAQEIKLREQAGSDTFRLNSQEAQRRADNLRARFEKRMGELTRERQISPLPPVVLGGFLVVPSGLIELMKGIKTPKLQDEVDKQAVAAKAREIVLETERALGYEPIDRELDKVGYDIESRVPNTGRLRFIEVKGRVADAATITVTKNEILCSLNQPENYILAIVEFRNDGTHRVRYLRTPFGAEPDFDVTSVNYDLAGLLARSEEPS
ncbi:MAG TPA: helicase-related protein, partial [Candidatus Latescibacteria bacterium]|nr:helicase-related protein [Candidatus Latescibacterota bacterium]